MKPIVIGVLCGLVFFGYSVAVLEVGKDLGEMAAEPLYYCSKNSTLYMVAGEDETDIVIGAVIDPISDVRVGCNSPGKMLDRDEIAVPSLEHLITE